MPPLTPLRVLPKLASRSPAGSCLCNARNWSASPSTLRPISRRSISSRSTRPNSSKTNRGTLIASGLLLVSGTSFLALGDDADAVHTSSPAPAILDPNDPLSALNPVVLASSTCHLQKASLGSLWKQYFIYLASGQPAIVNSGPWILQKLEWTRDHVPVLGTAIWGAFAFVSLSSLFTEGALVQTEGEALLNLLKILLCLASRREQSMRVSFYDHFVGGGSVQDCARLISNFAGEDIGACLNYSAEAFADGATGVNDAHVLESVTAFAKVARPPFPGGLEAGVPYTIKPTMIAVKVTGLLFEPGLLARASSALVGSSSYARSSDMPAGILFPNSPDLSSEDHAQLGKLYQGLRDICRSAEEGGVRILIDAEQSWYQPAIDYYADLLSEEFNKVTPRNASTGPAIPIVFNTYQCYLRTAEPKMVAALARSEARGYSFGAKLVRGAYVEAERSRHEASGAPGPCIVWSNKAESDACYDNCAVAMEKQIAKELESGKKGVRGSGVVLASHNGTSVKKVLSGLRDDGLAVNVDGALKIDERLRGRVSFAQLMGMSDNLTNTILQITAPNKDSNPSSVPYVAKYLPYATLDQALPYLIRRAYENQSILKSDPTSGRGGAAGERKAIGREIRRRFGIPF